MLMAGSSGVKKKRVKLSDLDPKLKKYEKTTWDGLAKRKVRYIVTGNEKVDSFSLQSALIYGSFVQARFVSKKLGRDMKTLKKTKNKQALDNARENAKIAQEILQTAIANAPQLYQTGQDLVSNPMSLLANLGDLPEILKSLKKSVENLYQVTSEGPALVKDLVSISGSLAGL
jgi:hypothetical protein